jgi:hypothetical protein
MWVWSDELVERVSITGNGGLAGQPLVAYAVASDADLEELALEVLSGSKAERVDSPSPDRETAER